MRSMKLILLSVFLFSGIAHAGLRGDWQSAGAPIPPYDPPYKFLYRCQAELTDNEERVGQGKEVATGRPYRLYAVQNFELSRGKTFTDFSGKWQWVAKMLDSEDRSSAEIELKNAPKDAFSLSGHGSGITLGRSSNPADDRVTLSAHVKLSLGDYYLSSSEQETTSRAASSVHVRASAYLYREEGQPESLPRSKARSMFVVCDKVR